MKAMAFGLALLVLPIAVGGGGGPAVAQAAGPGAEGPANPPVSAPSPEPTAPPAAPPAPVPSTPVDGAAGTGGHAAAPDAGGASPGGAAGGNAPNASVPGANAAEVNAPNASVPGVNAATPSVPKVPDVPIERKAPRYRDALHDHVLLVPTAETHPAGTFFVSDYEVVIVQVGYAVSDRTEVTLSGAPPLGADHIVPLDLSAKTTIVRDGSVSVALFGSASGFIGVTDATGFVGRAGGAVTFCEPAWLCQVSFTFATNVALVGPASVVFSGVGGVYRFDDHFALLAELDTAVPLGPDAGEVNGITGGAGVRFTGRAFGVDLALFEAGKAGERPTPIIPFASLTWRTTPWRR